MPLSKLKQAEYQRGRRARIKTEKQHIVDAVSPSIRREGYGKASSTVIPIIDADGNAIPDYD